MGILGMPWVSCDHQFPVDPVKPGMTWSCLVSVRVAGLAVPGFGKPISEVMVSLGIPQLAVLHATFELSDSAVPDSDRVNFSPSLVAPSR
jgi:hypothetical protein